MILGDFDIGPALTIGKHQHDRLGMLVDLILVLSELIPPPCLLGQAENFGFQWLDIVGAKVLYRYANVHIVT